MSSINCNQHHAFAWMQNMHAQQDTIWTISGIYTAFVLLGLNKAVQSEFAVTVDIQGVSSFEGAVGKLKPNWWK